MTRLAEALSALDGKSALGADDALALRHAVYADGPTIGRAEAEALFKLNAEAAAVSPEVSALFIEAMTDYVVRQQAPQGYIDEAKADWLIAQVSGHAHIHEDEVEMLVHVLEEADEAPAKLSDFVLSTVKALTLWRIERKGALAVRDIDRLRRVVFAKGGEANIAVTRREAEALFEVNDALKELPPNPTWTDFFVRAVANAVLFEPVWKPDLAAELRREAEIEDLSIHPLRRILVAFSDPSIRKAGLIEGARETAPVIYDGDFSVIGAHDLDPMQDRFAADQGLEAEAEAITADEARWLADRIGRDGRIDDNERALVAFLRENARSIDPALPSLLAQLEAPPAAAAG